MGCNSKDSDTDRFKNSTLHASATLGATSYFNPSQDPSTNQTSVLHLHPCSNLKRSRRLLPYYQDPTPRAPLPCPSRIRSSTKYASSFSPLPLFSCTPFAHQCHHHSLRMHHQQARQSHMQRLPPDPTRPSSLRSTVVYCPELQNAPRKSECHGTQTPGMSAELTLRTDGRLRRCKSVRIVSSVPEWRHCHHVTETNKPTRFGISYVYIGTAHVSHWTSRDVHDAVSALYIICKVQN